MTNHRSLRILISPLDWGLGHTTRCVPLIRHIREQGHTVIFAGNDWQRKYITDTFDNIECLQLNGYNVHYSKSGKGFMFTLFSQLPDLLRTIRMENHWLKQAVEEHHIDAVISDNRYGLYHTTVPCVIMTHQVLAQTGIGTWADNILRGFHYKWLKRYDHCWVIDVAGTPNLSGKLGHPYVLPENATYLGMLSQIIPAYTSESHLMILLSGPEPQRTLLSDILWQQVQQYEGNVIFVEGSDIKNRLQDKPELAEKWQGKYFTRITSQKLQPLLENASLVICRSGYSTLMDLAVLQKKAILIPTPGQTEQEYLGRHLHREGVFYFSRQKGFDLQKTLDEAARFPFRKLEFEAGFDTYKNVVEGWLHKQYK